ncbi:MAG: methyltransferase domain-containing protein [Phycisphaerae bacterium]|nr:methyltransferase domain-containing protein [Phycisphaerae bacterium]
MRGRTYELLAPAKGEALLDDPRVVERFERDEYMPYWAMLWPAALLLADIVATWEPAASHPEPPTVLELGCGLGLVGLVAARLGYRVTVSDHDEDALAFARESARRNGLPPPATRYFDWREAQQAWHVDRIVAADVLYEARNLEPVAEFIRQHLNAEGFALLSDPHRRTADSFELTARACGLSVAVTAVERSDEGGLPIRGRIFHLRHRATRLPS